MWQNIHARRNARKEAMVDKSVMRAKRYVQPSAIMMRRCRAIIPRAINRSGAMHAETSVAAKLAQWRPAASNRNLLNLFCRREYRRRA